jgi:predicted 3-demethylubiquinone-9 3-methyltransferase (glyoxalase superfamily)
MAAILTNRCCRLGFEPRWIGEDTLFEAEEFGPRPDDPSALTGWGEEGGAMRVEHASKIGPCLWFDDQAEEAADFYVTVFSARRATTGDGGESKILGISRYGEAGPGPAGTVMTVDFLLEGQEFVALNGGPEFSFTPAISFIVNCETQDEVDGLWETLSQGGTQGECGWLEDRFGVSWQIVPTALGDLLADPDPARTQRVMRAMLEMRKLDIAGLERAAQAV